ncbi:MAG TPA: Uma2 family endonuclease [Candidatus Wallbacteria bacterium]|nr:Uma2 family endonuclease [Candidatus Wallbacteria bacterium]
MAGLPLKKPEYEFTYGDYRKWDDDKRWELIDGIAYDMTPAPLRLHQKIFVKLLNKFANYLNGKECEVYGAPFDVRLPEGDEADDDVPTVVQPDILVVCDKSKLDRRGMRGAPDLIVEILSEHTSKKDMTVKLDLYERHRVKEYWIVNPDGKNIMVFKFDNKSKKYKRPETYFAGDELKVGIFKNLKIKLDDVFKED